MVAIHDSKSRPTRWKLTAFKVPLQRPTPTVAPVIHIDVETGRENCEKTRTVTAAPISMEHPVAGVSLYGNIGAKGTNLYWENGT